MVLCGFKKFPVLIISEVGEERLYLLTIAFVIIL